jgi:small-conductance mechanosensitive channel
MDNFDLKKIWEQVVEFFQTPIFNIGEAAITLYTIFYIVVYLILLFYISAKIRSLLVHKILSRYKIDIGVSQAIGTIVRYIITVFGLIILIQSAGIDLRGLGLAFGALGVGIGLGLQGITNNFISGIIILFERPIKVGDRIEIGLIKGDVVRISPRATTIITNDNISVIVPNSEFITTTVINWSHNDRMVRFNFPIHVSYKEDPQKIKKLLMEVARDNPGVLTNPAPDVLFDHYGDNGLQFNLRVWTLHFIDRPNVLKSQLYYSIFTKFKEQKIEIPFPQRSLHFKSSDINLPGFFRPDKPKEEDNL